MLTFLHNSFKRKTTLFKCVSFIIISVTSKWTSTSKPKASYGKSIQLMLEDNMTTASRWVPVKTHMLEIMPERSFCSGKGHKLHEIDHPGHPLVVGHHRLCMMLEGSHGPSFLSCWRSQVKYPVILVLFCVSVSESLNQRGKCVILKSNC